LAVGPCQDYVAALLAGLLRLDLGAGLDDDAALLQRLAELLGSVSIGARRDLLEQLHYRHAAAKRLVDVGELEPDGSCPDHQEALGHAVTDGQGAGGINDPVTVEFEAGDDYRARAGGDDERLGRVLLLTYRDRVGVDERRCASEQRYLVALEQHADAASHLLDDALLEALDLVEVDARFREGDTERLCMLGVTHFGTHMEQRFGWDAADVEAHAADSLLLYTRYFEPELRCADGGVITTWS